LFVHFILLNAANAIGAQVALKLVEALKSNSSLTFLNISSNRISASFHSHKAKTIQLALKQLSNCLKRSSQIHLSQTSISVVTDLLLISFSLNTGNNIGPEGGIKLAEALKSNATLTSLDLNGMDFLLHFILTRHRK
jgi:hypothetical protein